ncbi:MULTISPECIES: hypothetical protein [unclassified Enterococcus]|uniref:hypothetical protein n=1 Tax=unclassified Enterococcus TaxID=2608891 RepID=UPI0015517204|nr:MULTISPECIES: hypothetical protein [unclassified Enterococcus]MBS7577621.1 hypothetical protein [Enterococcus sp. MMGLQ5-2]MBS7584185.1 hypothetical protein [Enterococcus sp. MMGLQ5-1]NPD12043.1 hypothetical protein [Enterococcus sp. MMGLQ5-1]NPD37454.1 hypothetical protein [Enterococcus sp. MMGLQ5-2]
MSENNKVDSNDVMISAIQLKNAITGLDTYVNDHLSSCDNLSPSDINGLNGLVFAIKALSDYNERITVEVLENVKY